MEFRQLKYFACVARNRKYTTAAEQLHISQPSLSNAIKTLEKELDCQLIERTTREVKLTEAGEVFYKHACHILNEVQHAQMEMKEVKDIGKGEISIGVIESAKFWMPKIIKLFRETYSNVSIKIKELIEFKQIEEALISYDIHFGITPRSAESSKLKSIPIYQENFVLIVPPDHPLKNSNTVSLIKVKSENLILSQQGYQTRQNILEACRKAGFEPKGLYEIERFETARSLVESGLGISILPENYLKYAPLSGIHLLKIVNPTPKRNVYLTYHTERYLPPAVYHFMSLIKSFFDSKS
ncbi:LysR family transcriptional regulator [Scopulibacillus cellulosilyticus]|uniref:LysR family transcriptional regulator n=1 Tax=Scopulibacillus cellulosilyticus TaxID=2665665 RepID=A0ABW2PWR4_9BACL